MWLGQAADTTAGINKPGGLGVCPKHVSLGCRAEALCLDMKRGCAAWGRGGGSQEEVSLGLGLSSLKSPKKSRVCCSWFSP